MSTQGQIITPTAPADTEGYEAEDRDVDEDTREWKSERTSFLPEKTSAQADERWQQIQAQFVDDPRKSVGEAHALVGDLMQRIADAFARERNDLESQWSKGDDVSTEDLRVCLQRYRGFFSKLLPSVNELEKQGH